jgi:hypothetical protein
LSGTTPILTPTPTPIAAPSTSLFESKTVTASTKTGGEETTSVIITSSSVKGGGGSTGSPSASSSLVQAGGAGRFGGSLSAYWGGVWIFGFFVMAPGILMVWL